MPRVSGHPRRPRGGQSGREKRRDESPRMVSGRFEWRESTVEQVDGVPGGVGRGVFHTPYPLVLARKTRERSL